MRYDQVFVHSVHTVAPAVLAEIIRRQPASKERTAFAWSVAVGPALARVTTVELRGRTLAVAARDPRWAKEIERATPTILARVRQLLGEHVVESIEVQV
jgi:predicted nucleic acid-binding Zn ribbon protein